MRLSRQLLAASLISATLLGAACATRPKPLVSTTPQAPSQPASLPPPVVATTNLPPPVQTVQTPPVVSNTVLPGSAQDFVVNVGDRVYFDLDSFTVRQDAQAALNAQAAWLARYPNVNVRIEGNADERGTREYNLALGSRRANSVKDFLVARGVSAARITTLSYGKERPMDAGTGEAAWAKNRNAQSVIIGR